MVENNKSQGLISVELAILIAVANLAFFGGMFAAMHYFELLGADPSYFDEGTFNNLKMINSILGSVGFEIDPASQEKISTLGYSVCLGLALVSSFFAIVISNRKPLSHTKLLRLKRNKGNFMLTNIVRGGQKIILKLEDLLNKVFSSEQNILYYHGAMPNFFMWMLFLSGLLLLLTIHRH